MESFVIHQSDRLLDFNPYHDFTETSTYKQLNELLNPKSGNNGQVEFKITRDLSSELSCMFLTYQNEVNRAVYYLLKQRLINISEYHYTDDNEVVLFYKGQGEDSDILSNGTSKVVIYVDTEIHLNKDYFPNFDGQNNVNIIQHSFLNETFGEGDEEYDLFVSKSPQAQNATIQKIKKKEGEKERTVMTSQYIELTAPNSWLLKDEHDEDVYPSFKNITEKDRPAIKINCGFVARFYRKLYEFLDVSKKRDAMEQLVILLGFLADNIYTTKKISDINSIIKNVKADATFIEFSESYATGLMKLAEKKATYNDVQFPKIVDGIIKTVSEKNKTN